MNIYVVTVKSDRGRVKIEIIATSPDMAALSVSLAEGCPLRAIVKVKQVKERNR